jgi:hypothetical protein
VWDLLLVSVENCLVFSFGNMVKLVKEFIIYNVQYVNAPYCSITSKPIADIKQLSKWRDTLAIILANRTANDAEALTALGDIMKEQGWIEAAHIW